ncbi:TIGR02147 family protein [Bdellovibrio sp. BCCA]|uniref:TIGR02147 family protein n=1 Tax=Bdellovibrio sp. BCCA TaxID=3136281 RepID=UPI0030F25130
MLTKLVSENNSSLSLFLHEILDSRKKRNSQYSLRAFARDLEISPGRLSDFLSGRRIPGKRLSARMIMALKMTEDESAKFQHLISRNREYASRIGGAHLLREDEFSLIADWEHFALLMLMGTSGFSDDVAWMAKRLQTSELKIQNAIERMERLGLVKRHNGRLKRLKSRVSTTHEIPSTVVKESHRQILEHALLSLQKDDISVRDITSITIPADPAKLDEAKKHIRNFRRKMAELLNGENKSEVYNLNIQLVPVTKVKK